MKQSRFRFVFLLGCFLSMGHEAYSSEVEKKEYSLSVKDFSFSPEQIILEQGVPVKIYFTNGGSVKHEFVSEIFKEFDTEIIAEGVTVEGRINEIEINPGKTVEVEFTPTKKGVFPYICEIKNHLNMKGSIEVK